MFPQYDQLILKPQLCSLFFHHAVILLLLIDRTGQSQTGTSSQTIIAFVGENVILPCHLEPASDAVSKSVEWRRLDLDPTYVHVWNEGPNHLVNQNPSYKGRTALSTGKLRLGDFSLKLSRVRHSDSGTYTCYFPSEVKRSTVELLIRSAIMPINFKSDAEDQTDTRNAQMESGTGWHPCIYTYDIADLALDVVFFLIVLFLFFGVIWIFLKYKKSRNNEEVYMSELIALMKELKRGHLQQKEEFKLLEETNKELAENKEKLCLLENEIARSEKEKETNKTEIYLEEKQSLLSVQRKLEKRKEELENLQLNMEKQLQQTEDIMSRMTQRREMVALDVINLQLRM